MKDRRLICPKCKRKTYIQLERKNAFQRGWGCLKCGTAVLIKTVCSVCNRKLDIYIQPYVELDHKVICEKCLTNLGESYPFLWARKIPTWRLNLDDASPGEIISKPLSEFGTPYMSEQKWKEFYNQPHEVEKLKQFYKEREKMKKEAIKELVRSKREEEG